MFRYLPHVKILGVQFCSPQAFDGLHVPFSEVDVGDLGLAPDFATWNYILWAELRPIHMLEV